jgi:hypothetical protein
MKYNIIKLVALMSAIGLFIGCGPANVDRYVEILPNETAFVLPLEGATKNQKQFKSIEFLEEHKVAAKRIMIPQRKMSTGRAYFSYEYKPNIMVIRVDRAPVTREWTKESQSGTSSSDDALYVESKESIEFGVPLTVTAYVKEENTAKFLYYYAGKPLASIIDKNIRGYCLANLGREFAADNLEIVRTKKPQIIDALQKEAITFFEIKGITIEYIGTAGGLRYTDSQIQTSINNNFSAALLKIQAKDERLAAQEFVIAAAAQKKKVELEITQMQAQIQLNYSEAFKTKWNGQLPTQVIPGTVVPFFDIKGAKK